MLSQSFEVIPDNGQWAYEAVEKLIKAGLIEEDIIKEELEGVPTVQINNEYLNLDISEETIKKNKIYGLLISPLFNLIIGYLALLLYIKKEKLWMWALALGSQMRMLKSLFQVLFINDNVDEVIVSSYLGLPSYAIYFVSIIISAYCLILLFKYFKYETESVDILILSTVLGGGLAFIVLEIIRQVYVNSLIYFR